MAQDRRIARPRSKGRMSRSRAIDDHIGTRIRARRLALGLTLTCLADRLEISYQQLHKNERGVNHVPIARLYDLARCLEVPVRYFFQGLNSGRTRLPKRADPMFLMLAEAFVRLDRQDRIAVAAVARQLARLPPHVSGADPQV
jgi:transcriptional regulator with XRE-family HTH domain